MNPNETRRLIQYQYAKKHRPYTTSIGRRHAKGRAKGVGQMLKTFRIIPIVPLDKVFVKHH